MLSSINKVATLLTSKERKETFKVIFLTLISALFEVIGIASILPFIAVLASPEIVETNKYLNWGYEFFSFASTNSYLFFLGIGVMVVLFLSNGIKAYTRWATLNFTIMTGHKISSRLFSNYLHQPYSYFLKKNSTQLSKNILQEIHAMVTNIITPMAEVVARTFSSIAIIFLLMFADPILAVCTGFVLGGGFCYNLFDNAALAFKNWNPKKNSVGSKV